MHYMTVHPNIHMQTKVVLLSGGAVCTNSVYHLVSMAPKQTTLWHNAQTKLCLCFSVLSAS